MRTNAFTRFTLLWLAPSVLGPLQARSEALPVLLDGYTEEWTIQPIYTDPAGDAGSSGIDFRNVWVAEDEDFLFMRFEVTAEIVLQDGSGVVLYLDADSDAETGAPVENIGAEVRWLFGERTGTFYGDPPLPIGWGDIRLREAPTWSATEFEIAIGRNAEPDGETPLFTADAVRILIRDEPGGDTVPEPGEFMTYTFTNEPLDPEPPNSMEKESPGHVRSVTYNVLQDSPWGSGQNARYDRILSAISPEIINFQEIYDHTAAQTRVLVESFLPSGPDENWYASEVSDCITVSRFPISDTWSLDGNLAALLETDEPLGRKLLVVNAHLPCCSNDSGRQEEVDRIMGFIRDAKTPGGSVDLPAGTGILITGDLNLVGDVQQLVTLLTGDIVDEATFGPDFDPDWDGSPLSELVSPQTELRMTYTWRNDSSSYLPGRLDMVITSDSVLGIGNHFTLYTPNMSAEALAAAGLLADDIPLASDHIPHVADLYDGEILDVAGVPPAARLGLRISPNPMRARGVIRVGRAGLQALRVDLFDVSGRLVRRLVDLVGAAPMVGAAPGFIMWDGRTETGARAPSGVYFVRASGRVAGVRFTDSMKITLVE